MTLRCS